MPPLSPKIFVEGTRKKISEFFGALSDAAHMTFLHHAPPHFSPQLHHKNTTAKTRFS